MKEKMDKFIRLGICAVSTGIFQSVFAQSITAQLRNTGQKGQQIFFAALPLAIIAIGYLYLQGKPEAKDRMEKLIVGGILVATAFGWSFFFK